MRLLRDHAFNGSGVAAAAVAASRGTAVGYAAAADADATTVTAVTTSISLVQRLTLQLVELAEEDAFDFRDPRLFDIAPGSLKDVHFLATWAFKK